MEGLPPTLDDAGDNLYSDKSLALLKKDIVRFISYQGSSAKTWTWKSKGKIREMKKKNFGLGDDKK